MASFYCAGRYYTGRCGQTIANRVTQLWTMHWSHIGVIANGGNQPLTDWISSPAPWEGINTRYFKPDLKKKSPTPVEKLPLLFW